MGFKNLALATLLATVSASALASLPPPVLGVTATVPKPLADAYAAMAVVGSLGEPADSSLRTLIRAASSPAAFAAVRALAESAATASGDVRTATGGLIDEAAQGVDEARTLAAANVAAVAATASTEADRVGVLTDGTNALEWIRDNPTEAARILAMLSTAADAADVDAALGACTLDNVAPTVTISSAQTSPTIQASLHLTVTFSEPVVDFDEADLSAAGIAYSGFSGSGATYEFDSAIAEGATNTYALAAGAARDAAGNASVASNSLAVTRASTPTFGGIVDVLATSNGNSLMAFWEPASDAVTPAQGLAYEVCVRVVDESLWTCKPPVTNVTNGTVGDGDGIELDIAHNSYDIKVNAINVAELSSDGGVTRRTGSIGVISQIAAGASHTCVLTESTKVLCWGVNFFGELGDGTTVSRHSPALVVNAQGVALSGVSQITVGNSHSCAIIFSVPVCWGLNSNGQLGINLSDSQKVNPTSVYGLSGVSQIAAGAYHTCAVVGGAVNCWGMNGSGQLGTNSTTDSIRPVQVLAGGTSFTGVASIATGKNYTCALKIGGSLYCWGANNGGQIGDGTSGYAYNRKTPTQVVRGEGPGGGAYLAGVNQVALGDTHTCAVVSTFVYCWGLNDKGQLGDFTTVAKKTPTRVVIDASKYPLLFPSKIAVGDSHSCAVLTSGSLKCWGDNYYGKLGAGSAIATSAVPVQAAGLTSGVTQVSAGGTHTCVVVSGGMKCFGNNDVGQLGTRNSAPYPVAVPSAPPQVASVATGGFHVCALTEAGTVFCWGGNAAGQLGDGTTVDRYSPVQVLLAPATPLTGVTQVAVGNGHTCAAVTDGADHKLMCWGSNDKGQLGIGSNDNKSFATPVIIDPNVTQVAAGQKHTCAVVAGALKCWGNNEYSQLGDNTVTAKTLPTSVLGTNYVPLAGVTQVATGVTHSCAVAAGAVLCWGHKGNGKIGDGGTSGTQTTAKQVIASGASRVAASDYHTCAVVTAASGEGDGEIIKCWGYNSAGQLGDNSTVQKNTPTQVTGITSGVSQISLGAYTTCALVGGALNCWGQNAKGQLGIGSSTSQYTPTPVPGLTTGVSSVSVGANSDTCAAVNGRAMCWGFSGGYKLISPLFISDVNSAFPVVASGAGEAP